MEETFMKHSKSRGGAGGCGSGPTGLLSNFDSYHRWVRTTHERTKYANFILDMAGMTQSEEDGTKHRDLRPSEIIKSETAVINAQAAVKSFINPFSEEAGSKCIILSSRASVSEDVTQDICTQRRLARLKKKSSSSKD
jgi:hypothetical protein